MTYQYAKSQWEAAIREYNEYVNLWSWAFKIDGLEDVLEMIAAQKAEDLNLTGLLRQFMAVKKG